MSDEAANPLGEFGASFKGFLDQIAMQAPAEEPSATGILTRRSTNSSLPAGR